MADKDFLEELAIDLSSEYESIAFTAQTVAHDLNNSLAAMMGYAELALIRSDSSEVKKDISAGIEAIRHAQCLTQQLATSAKGIQRPAPVNIEKLVKDTAGMVLGRFEVGLRCDFDEDLDYAYVGHGCIRQLIQNLAINAVQAGASQVMFYAGNEKVAEGPLAKGDYVKITIKDDGQGIPESYLQKVFQPYFTTKEKGTGLGLAACNRIVHAYKGLIEVRSELGKGTIFEVYLPATKKKGMTNAPLKSDPSGNGKIVLLVEDDPLFSGAMQRMLKHYGFNVDHFAEADEAYSAYDHRLKAGMPYDLIITDMNISSGISGVVLNKKIRALNSEAIMILTSGDIEAREMREYENYGFDAALRKPMRLKELGLVLKEVLRE
ncbi:MAG: ATP-binding protein [Candidatus Nanoarchaeia archaeon]